MPEHTIDFRVTCDIITEDEAKEGEKAGRDVWTWCASGMDNWVEPGIVRTNVLVYLSPRQPFDLPPDAEEYLPPEDYVDEMSAPTLADLCEDREQAARVRELFTDEMTWAEIASAIGCPPGEEIAHMPSEEGDDGNPGQKLPEEILNDD